MREKLTEAMGYISDHRIAHAAKARRIKKRWFVAAVAAVMALVMFGNVPTIPLLVGAKAVSLASMSNATPYPERDDYDSYEEFKVDLDAWNAQRTQTENRISDTASAMTEFCTDAAGQILSQAQGNAVWSPVNAYIGLAMLAETTAGTTQAELLALLGSESTELLRQQIDAVWESVYQDNGDEICVLANSLWLDRGLDYDSEVMDTLASDYHASVYQTELRNASRAMSNWLTNQTGGFLKDRTDSVQLPEETVLALASTVYFQSKWSTEFHSRNNTHGLFHSPDGDTECTYMNQKLREMYYYWNEDYAAVSLGMKNGTRMWIILPDDDKTVDDVLASGAYAGMISDPHGYENSKYMKVNLTVPKFDVSGTVDLKQDLHALGVSEIFSTEADFGETIRSEIPVWIDSIQQSTRVSIDEEGVTAASYIVIIGAGAAEPPEEIVDFIADRPFLFAISSDDGIPLFMGVVNEP